MAEIYQQLSAAIRARRNSLGLTQAAVAERAGISQPQLGRIESTTGNPSIGTIAKVLEVLECNEPIITFNPTEIKAMNKKQRYAYGRMIAIVEQTIAPGTQYPLDKMIAHPINITTFLANATIAAAKDEALNAEMMDAMADLDAAAGFPAQLTPVEQADVQLGYYQEKSRLSSNQ